jgi:hypothetical protein
VPDAKQVATHAAGHIVYAARMGAKRFVVRGAHRRDGTDYQASVEPIFDGLVKTDPVAVAFYWAAGGVADHVLTGKNDGASQDFPGFVEQARLIPKFPLALCGPVWDTVCGEIAKQLTPPAVQTLMRTLAARVEGKIAEANKSPERKVACTISELVEVPRLLQLLD